MISLENVLCEDGRKTLVTPIDANVAPSVEVPNDVTVFPAINTPSDMRHPPNNDVQQRILKCVYMNINGLGDKLTIEDNIQSLDDNDIIVISGSWITILILTLKSII